MNQPGRNQSAEPAQRRPANFSKALVSALTFPVTGRGRMMLVAGAVCFFAIEFVSRWSLVGFIGDVLLWGYLSLYMMEVVGRVAGGADEPPQWPALTDPWDIFYALVRMVAVLIISFFPAIVYVVALLWGYRPGGEWKLVLTVLLLLGSLYFPMALLASTLHDSLSGAGATVVIPAIVRVALPYAAACGAMGIAVYSSAMLTRSASAVPVLGGVLIQIVSLYFLMVEMYILGMIYRFYEGRLGWFSDA